MNGEKEYIRDDSLIDYLYAESLEGADMETGSVQENGVWFGFIRLNPSDTLEIADTDHDGDYQVAIISEDAYGFKRGDLYTDTADAEEDWTNIEAHAEAMGYGADD